MQKVQPEGDERAARLGQHKSKSAIKIEQMIFPSSPSVHLFLPIAKTFYLSLSLHRAELMLSTFSLSIQ
jgi:hypothetical protein